MATATTKVKKIKRLVPLLTLHAYTEEHFRFIESGIDGQDKVFTGAIDSIKYALAEGKNEAEVFLLQDYTSVVALHKKDWHTTLNKAMIFYADNGNFDKAIECQDLISLL